MKKKQQFTETLYADVEYFDEKGNFDFKKFADGAADTEKRKNKEKAEHQLQELQQKWDLQRKEIKNEQMQVKIRPVSDQNKKQLQIIEELNKKKANLQNLVKNSQNINEEIKQKSNKVNQLKKQPVVKKIDQQMDKLTADEARVRLFRFDQMEKIIIQ